MVLTPASLIHYLLDRDLVNAGTVVDGDFRVTDLSRRNQAFQIAFRTRPGYVVKQVGDWSQSNTRTFAAEAHWYWLARNHPGFAPMRPFLSACSAYDAENQVLILDVPEKCEDLDRYHRRIGRYPVEAAQLLGETLAAFHRALPENVLQELRTDFREAAPWILSWPEANPGQLDSSEAGAAELLRVVKSDPQFARSFEELREGWRRETLINGDMKFAHCVCHGAALYFIDWEMADYGDPCWDAGAVFQEYLSSWLRSMPAAPGLPLAAVVRQARRPLEQIQPAIRAFWESYTAHVTGNASGMLDRAVGYAAAWLIQVAYQSLKDAGHISTRAVRMAQLSRNMLADRAAARGLLGC